MLAPSTIDRTDWHPTLVLLFLLLTHPSPKSNGYGNLPNIGVSKAKEGRGEIQESQRQRVSFEVGC